jgi:hypothetical protein
MERWQHTSITLSAPFRALLARVAPRRGDRSAGLRALALVGAAQIGLPLGELRGELPGLLATPLHPQLQDALLRLYRSEPLNEEGQRSGVAAAAQHEGIGGAGGWQHHSILPEAQAGGNVDFGSVGLEV